MIQQCSQLSASVFIRAALDDANLSARVAGIDCCHAFLTSNADLLQSLYAEMGRKAWYRGFERIPLTPWIEMELERQESCDPEDERSASNRDLILTFVEEMDLLPRLRYLIEMEHRILPPSAILQCLEILERCAAHSAVACAYIFRVSSRAMLGIDEC